MLHKRQNRISRIRKTPLLSRRLRRTLPIRSKRRYGKLYRRRHRKTVSRRYPHHRKRLPRRLVVVGGLPPTPVVVQHLNSRLSLDAREALRRHNLTTAYWLKRLRSAPGYIINFIENYHNVSGFQHVLWAYYGSRYGRKQVRMLLRVLRDLASRNGNLRSRLQFRRGMTIDEAGDPVRIALFRYSDRSYRVLPSGVIGAKP